MKRFLLILTILFFFLPAFSEEEVRVLPSVTGVVKNIEYAKNEIEGTTTQLVTVKLLGGEDKGRNVLIENMLSGNPYYDIYLKNNTRVILHTEEVDGETEYSIEDIKRSGTLLWLSLIFCGLLIYVGRKKGILSLLSIGITVILVRYLLTPLILAGISPVASSALICLISTAVTMYFVGGFNAKSTSAIIGASASLIFAGLLSFITMYSAHLTGFTAETSMFLYTAHPELSFVQIAISCMVLATLGAVMDVAMSIASTINEIHITNPKMGVKDLFFSGMNVGRDIIGTMANTLILVYLGGSLPLLLLAGNIDIQKFINLNQVVTEVASAIIGSIAIVICVPFTAIAASEMIKRFYSNITEEEFENIV